MGNWAVLAVAIGVITVAVVLGLHASMPGARLDLADELPVLLFQTTIVAGPFLILAFLGIRAVRAWLDGMALTAAFWGFYLYKGISHYGDGSGADIGLGLLMLASPVVILAACLAFGLRRTR